MPAEWEPHEATWIAWPHNRSDWPGKFEAIPWIYAEIVRHLARVERVNILVNDEAAEAKARQVLVRSHVLPEKAARSRKTIRQRSLLSHTDESWLDARLRADLRASRLAQRRTSAVAATAWRFNAWAKYNDWKFDALAGAEIADRLRVPAWQPEMRHDGEHGGCAGGRQH